jgi:CBS domain-containing protein
MKSMGFQSSLLRSLTVKLIMTPKDRFVTCKDDEPITSVIDKLRKYDILPVSSEKIRYFVSKTRVEGLLGENRSVHVREVKQSIFDNYQISGDEPIYQYLLQRKEPVFVTEQNEVIGIVTPADLNKIPSKMLFYILISYFEQLLIKSIKDLELTEKEIEGCIGFTRWWQAKGRHEQATRENFQLSLIECLNTNDLIDLACKRPDIRRLLNYQSESEARENLKPLVYLRNKVMHAGHFIIQNEKQLIKRRAEYERIRQHIFDLVRDTATLIDVSYVIPGI